MATSLSAYPSETESLGYFRIFARKPGGPRREITVFRGAPITPSSVSTADPFTEQVAQLMLPQVTTFDTPGEGDLDWMVPEASIDIVFENTGAYDFDWRWEGYIASESYSLSGASSQVTLDLKGALFALDNYLAMPGFPSRPIPYELLIAQDFDQTQHPCRLGKFQILWPSDWGLTVPEFKDPDYLRVLKPWGVTTGQKWTGFTSRSTGSWEPMLTGHIQTLLTVMFAAGGRQWSVRNIGQRRPQLFLRREPASNDSRIIDIQLGAPGVAFDGTRDFTQRADVIFGTGKDEAGVEFSGMQVSPDGRTTYFQPFAYSPATYPRKNNPMLDRTVIPKEVWVRFQEGVDEVSSTKIAQAQYQRFSEPGFTGTINLTTDPRYADGSICPRLLIKAGATLRINGLLGIKEGVLAHVVSSTADFKAMTTTLTYDTKYRDALTVDEVRARTRDSMTPIRTLQVGKYQNTVQDLILPWSYGAGSGIIPTPAKSFFLNRLRDSDVWPYENRTTSFPPSNPAYKNWYIRIGPTNTTDSSKNWTQVAVPIRMGQTGSIRLTQLAAYDKDGHVMPVKFHFSVYMGVTVTPDAMPKFPWDPAGVPAAHPDALHPKLPYLKARHKGLPGVRDTDRPVISTNYGTFQAHPLWNAAFQPFDTNGFTWPWGSDTNLAAKGANLVVGWGTYFEPAGYSPGRATKGGDRTGLYEDAVSWQWDLSSLLNFDSPQNNANQPYAGMLFLMIYCDDQGDEPVYFMGRFIRMEPGAS